MPPIVSIIGMSKSGKTTLIEALVRELKSRGWRVGTIKHTPQGATPDEPGKDSWRHLQAGSEVTAINAPDRVVVIKPAAPALNLEATARLLGEDCDIILAEGFKQEGAPKVEVHRREVGPPLSAVRKLVAIVTDEPLATKTRQFPLQDIKGLADFLENGFIKPHQERIAFYVNNVPVPLSSFPREVITSVLLALASSLRGVGEISGLDISLRRPSS